MENQEKKYPEGYFIGMWIGIGIVIFTGIGVPLSITTGNPGMLGIGPALGVSMGVAISLSIEDKYKKEGRIRPLTEAEEKRKKIGALVGLLVLAVLALFFLFLSKS